MAESTIIKEKSIGNKITISSYPFTAPCDGFIDIFVSPLNDKAIAYLYNTFSDGRKILAYFVPGGVSMSTSTPIKKGTTMNNADASNLGSSSYLYFIPIN